MRPSSSPSDEACGGGLFGGVLARGGVAAEVADRAWLRAMLDVEAALARAQARAGLISATRPRRSPRRPRTPSASTPTRSGAEAAQTGNPVVPLVKALHRRAVEGPAAGHVHAGATSQDIIDTAAMLVAHRALGPLLADLDAAAGRRGRRSPRRTAGRSWPGARCCSRRCPITFGLRRRLARRPRRGRRAPGRGPRHAARGAVRRRGGHARLARRGRAARPRPARRRARAGRAGARRGTRSARARPSSPARSARPRASSRRSARDVVLLAQTEVGEVREGVPGRGGSSTLPHKHNPVAAISAVAAAMRAPGLVATLLGGDGPRARARRRGVARRVAAAERAARGSSARPPPGCATASSTSRSTPARMRANLDLTRGALLAERVTTALAPALGRHAAHELVTEAARAAVADGPPARRRPRGARRRDGAPRRGGDRRGCSTRQAPSAPPTS